MIERVLYFTGFDIGKSDGPGVNEFEFTSALAKRFGENVWFVVARPSEAVPQLTGSNTSFYDCPKLRRLGGFLFCCLRVALRIRRTAKRNRVDMIVIRFGDYPVIPWLLTTISTVPIAVKTCSKLRFQHPPRGFLEKILANLDFRLKSLVVRKASAIDTVSEVFKELICEAVEDPDKIKVLRNATDVATFRPSSAKPTVNGADLSRAWPILGYVGGYPSERGALQLVETAQRLSGDYADLAVVVAGDDEELPEIVTRAKKLGVDRRCYFLGQRAYREIPDIINCFDIGFSFGPPAVATGFSAQKVYQYIASGKVVISIPGNHEFIAENDLGSLKEPLDFEGIAAAVKTWIERLKREGNVIQDKARRYAVENLSTDRALEERVVFWNECLNAKST